MFWSILHRTILWELVKVFSLALLGITGLLLLGGIVAEASQQGLSPAQILAAIPLLVPSTLPYTIPATTLFACCIVYGRLAHDNEILAIRAAGVNPLRIVWPAVVLGLVMSGVTMSLYYHLIPYTHRLLRSMALRDAEEFLYTMLSRERQINHPRLDYAMWVRQVQGRKLMDALFKKRDGKGGYDLIAWAREADLSVDMAHKVVRVRMRHAVVYSPGGNRSPESGVRSPQPGGRSEEAALTGKFEDRIWEVPLPPNFGLEKQHLRPRDQTWEEMLENRRKLAEQDLEVQTEMSLITSQLLMEGMPSHLHQHLTNLKARREFIRSEDRALEAELHMRPALAVGCFCFVLVGCPVGVWFSRSDYLSAFITCFLPIVFIYYPLMLAGTNVTRDGRLPTAVTVWAADVVLVVVGLLLFRRLLRN